MILYPPLERCPSGLRSTLGRRAQGKPCRGFESPSFRKKNSNYYISLCKSHRPFYFKMLGKKKSQGDSKRRERRPGGGKAAREGGVSDRSRPGGEKQGSFYPEGEPPFSNMSFLSPYQIKAFLCQFTKPFKIRHRRQKNRYPVFLVHVIGRKY